MTEWRFADELEQITSWCATFCRARWTPERGFIPMPDDDSATVSFIEFEGQTYAVTAFHVIDGFGRQSAMDNSASESFFVPTAPGVGIFGPFVRPPATLEHPQPDIALRPINRMLPPYVGKKAFKLQPGNPVFPVPYALAAGFPTSLKVSVYDSAARERLSLPAVIAAAEGVGSPASADQLQFFSEVDPSVLAGDISGLSGGPVFWSDGISYGLLGFVKEAMAKDADPPRVHFVCQRADVTTFAAWAHFADQRFPAEREALTFQAKANGKV